MPSSSDLPQKSLRASSQATAMPNGSATTVATSAIRSDRWIAIHSSGVRSNTRLAIGRPLSLYDVGLIRKLKPYFSNTDFDVPRLQEIDVARRFGLRA